MQKAFFEWKKRKSQGDSTQYPAETLLSSLTSLCGRSQKIDVGFAALRASHPSLLAGGALANYLKLTA